MAAAAARGAAIPRRLEKRTPGHARSRRSRYARPALAASKCCSSWPRSCAYCSSPSSRSSRVQRAG
eukprot:4887277-Prymnesium_polylepis.1